MYCYGKLSETKDITIGIPQGSVLGPSLFLVFINYITDCLRLSTCNIYADYVVLYVSDKDINVITSRLQADLYDINKWYCKNRLRININKSNVMLLSSNTRGNDELSLRVHIDTETIEQDRSIRYLGITIDDRLSWDIHIKSLTKSLSYKIFELFHFEYNIEMYHTANPRLFLLRMGKLFFTKHKYSFKTTEKSCTYYRREHLIMMYIIIIIIIIIIIYYYLFGISKYKNNTE